MAWDFTAGERRIVQALREVSSSVAVLGAGSWAFRPKGHPRGADPWRASWQGEWLRVSLAVADDSSADHAWDLPEPAQNASGRLGLALAPVSHAVWLRADLPLSDRQALALELAETCAPLSRHGLRGTRRGTAPESLAENWTGGVAALCQDADIRVIREEQEHWVIETDASSPVPGARLYRPDETLRVALELGRWESLGPWSQRAVRVCLLYLNHSLRLATAGTSTTAGFLDARVCAPLPKAPTAADLIRALGACATGAKLSYRELAVLADENCAKEYLEMRNVMTLGTECRKENST